MLTEKMLLTMTSRRETDDVGQARLAEILDEYLAAVEQGLHFEPNLC